MLATAAAAATDVPVANKTPATSETSVHLKTIDGSSYTVPYAWVNDSTTVSQWYDALDLKEKNNSTPTFQVPHVTPYILEIVLEFQQDHLEDAEFDEKNFKVEDIDEEFMEMPNEDLLQLTMAADILQLPRLIRTCAEVMAKRIEGKTPEEINALFDVDHLMEVDEMEDNNEELQKGAEKEASEAAPTDAEK